MAGPFPGQAVGSPNYCVLSWSDPAGLANVSISFLPTLVKMTNPQPAALQKVNVAIGGPIHVFQYSINRPVVFPLDMTDLPYDLGVSRYMGHQTDGFADLYSFINITVNFSEKPFTLLTPDGLVETVRYLKGIDQFHEATGQTNRAQFWTGQITLMRVIL